MKFKCECCGFEQEFESTEEAFREGWDTPPFFSYGTQCPLCPAICNPKIEIKGATKFTHEKAHALWKEKGRPKNFMVECFVDSDWRLDEKSK